jgi:hypothetical protein
MVVLQVLLVVDILEEQVPLDWLLVLAGEVIHHMVVVVAVDQESQTMEHQNLDLVAQVVADGVILNQAPTVVGVGVVVVIAWHPHQGLALVVQAL